MPPKSRLLHNAAPILQWVSLALFALPTCVSADSIGGHPADYDANGILQPWAPWSEILEREMNWYLNCPSENGYPRFVCMTFMDGDYNLISGRDDFIPSMQNGVGIVSYLKYYAYNGKKDARFLAIARAMGDYLVKESLTPDEGKYPRFTRSTGIACRTPQPPDCGEQDYDRTHWGGILSTYAAVLAKYCAATGSNEYKSVARQAMNLCLYAVNEDGCPADRADLPKRGGWQEDAHTDKVHNLLDALEAFPEWAK